MSLVVEHPRFPERFLAIGQSVLRVFRVLFVPIWIPTVHTANLIPLVVPTPASRLPYRGAVRTEPARQRPRGFPAD